MLFILYIQDSSGNTGLHVSIKTKNSLCSHLLLAHPSLDLTIRNKADSTVFASALEARDNEIGKAILQREPSAAEQVYTVVTGVAYTLTTWHTVFILYNNLL